MAKATVEREPVVPVLGLIKKVVLELTEEEAFYLTCLTGRTNTRESLNNFKKANVDTSSIVSEVNCAIYGALTQSGFYIKTKKSALPYE